MSQYYTRTIYIPKVTESGEIIGKVERWEAHEKRILHKAFSVALFYQNNIILQIRKHPVFDTVIDVTASSHPEMIDGEMEDEKGAVIRCLAREWNISIEKDLFKDIGSIYYKADDPKSEYKEHEYCTFYRTNIDKMPFPDHDVAYGYTLVSLEFLRKNAQDFNLAPWVVEAVSKQLL